MQQMREREEKQERGGKINNKRDVLVLRPKSKKVKFTRRLDRG